MATQDLAAKLCERGRRRMREVAPEVSEIAPRGQRESILLDNLRFRDLFQEWGLSKKPVFLLHRYRR